MNYSLINSTGIETDFQNWSSFNNRYGSKSYSPNKMPPKRLVQNAIREFESFCKTYHIDSSKYKFIEPIEIEKEWKQFDFKVSEDKRCAAVSVHSIVYRAGTYAILQSGVDLA